MTNQNTDELINYPGGTKDVEHAFYNRLNKKQAIKEQKKVVPITIQLFINIPLWLKQTTIEEGWGLHFTGQHLQ